MTKRQSEIMAKLDEGCWIEWVWGRKAQLRSKPRYSVTGTTRPHTQFISHRMMISLKDSGLIKPVRRSQAEQHVAGASPVIWVHANDARMSTNESAYPSLQREEYS